MIAHQPRASRESRVKLLRLSRLLPSLLAGHTSTLPVVEAGRWLLHDGPSFFEQPTAFFHHLLEALDEPCCWRAVDNIVVET